VVSTEAVVVTEAEGEVEALAEDLAFAVAEGLASTLAFAAAVSEAEAVVVTEAEGEVEDLAEDLAFAEAEAQVARHHSHGALAPLESDVSPELHVVYLASVPILLVDQGAVPGPVVISPLAEVQPIPLFVGQGRPNRVATRVLHRSRISIADSSL
jgi:hypothetical protein